MNDNTRVLRRDGVSVAFRLADDGLPAILHWGADLGDGALPADELDLVTSRQTAPGTLDAAWRVPIVPQEADGWAGAPGLLVTRDGLPVFPRWRMHDIEQLESGLVFDARDEAAGLTLRSSVQLVEGGLVLVEHEVRNDGESDLDVSRLDAILPVPKRAEKLTTYGGRWTGEKQPTTYDMPPGSTQRESRRGRGGHDAPWVAMASVGAPRNRAGEIWAVHLGWSGDLLHRVDRMTEHLTMIGAGELLRPAEIRLAPGESYHTPVAYFAWSDAGLDGISRRFHTWMRSRDNHPATPRPVVLNTWEAVYFDHVPAKLARLARRAAEAGTERFVLDDGWFPGRHNDTAGLGDWIVDREKWPDGLEPLAELVHELGMQFGLWFEPEMINLDSDLAREHPEWILGNPASIPSPEGLSWRTQYVLNLAHPGAFEHVRARMSDLVSALAVDFIKWDHNRDLVEAVHEGRPATHVQTLAAYRLMQRIKADHPGIEIESCSSGGARSDLGVLQYTDRVWASDSNDAIERQDIQRWTELLLPPELIGAHVGPSPAHSSGRTLDLSYRIITSLQGSAGFEWNLLGCSDDEFEQIKAFTAIYKQLRPVLHTGEVVHGDMLDPALRVRGVVAADRSEAVWTFSTVAAPRESLAERVQLDGLDPARRYRGRVLEAVGKAEWGWVTPGWLAAGEFEVSGRVLREIGLQLPTLWPAQAILLHLTAV
ncbi:alpha-galactosidase [Microbacterium sp.]|uniref:alpha-galactosidase n=1 Tax=Microbacterium sp. TaxID=51671 RepID=UPI0028119CEC|nr:alpha-galactosidase [Microbacterium sp.]